MHCSDQKVSTPPPSEAAQSLGEELNENTVEMLDCLLAIASRDLLMGKSNLLEFSFSERQDWIIAQMSLTRPVVNYNFVD